MATRRSLPKILAIGTFLLALTALPQGPADRGALAAERFCPDGTHPDSNVIFCDDFERGTGLETWASSPWCCDKDGDGLVSFAETEFVTCGSQGVRDNCAAWTDEYRYGQHYADRPVSALGLDELYVRWYAYISTPFAWGNTGDKNLIIHDGTGGIVNPYLALSMWGTGKPHVVVYNNTYTPCVSQDSPNANGEYPACVNRHQNVGNAITFQPGKWYLFEWYIKLNDPGVPNGVTKLWVDEASASITTQTLRLSYTDVFFRGSIHEDILLKSIWLSAYHNYDPPLPSQYVKWDNLVISRAPIGPIRGFQDDFEAATTNPDGSISGWDGPTNPSAMYVIDQASPWSGRAIELKYAPGSPGAGYMFKYFPGQDQLFHRWYQRWSPGFLWDPGGTGLVGLRPVSGYPQFYPLVLWGSGELAIQVQGILETTWDTRNLYQNQGPPVAFQPGRWYCIEVFVKLNTPGVADAELAAWIDGELKLLYTGRQFRGASPADPVPSTATIQAAMIDGYYGSPVSQLQSAWHDDHVASVDRVGCH